MPSISSVDALNLIIKHLESVVPDGLNPDPNLSFIEMGLDSLLMASLELYLQKHFNIRTGFLLECKTPEECAKKLSSLRLKWPIQKLEEVKQIPRLLKSVCNFPLSQAQKRLIFSASKHSPFEQIQIKVPQLDVQRFSEAWQLVSKRHSILRTSLSLNGQQILEEAVKMNAQIEDNLLKNPLRIRLINEKTIKLDYHHALIDGTSINLLMNELQAAYEDLESVSNSPIPPQYFEYCLFEEKYLNESNSKWPKNVNFWIGELKDFEEVFEDHKPTENSSSIEWKLDATLSKHLHLLAVQNQLTMFNLMSGLIRLLFYKLYDANDLTVGFPVEQRFHSDFEKTVGLFMNLNICRVRLDSTLTLIQFILKAAQKTNEATSHVHLPFNQLVNRLQASGIVESGERLLQLIIVNDKQTCAQTQVEVKTTGHSMPYPQIWYIQHVQLEESIQLRIEFDTDKFTTQCIQEEIRLFGCLCQKILDDPNQQIQEIGFAQMRHSDLTIGSPPDFLHCILNKLKKLPPNKIVLKSYNEKFCVHEFLSELSNAAQNLKEIVGQKEEKGVFVALMLPRSPELIFSLLGAWLSGYIVIPLDYLQNVQLNLLPSNSFIITDRILEGCSNVISVDRILKKNQQTMDRILPTFNPNDLCYCTFTSGSTGDPKLVMSERAGLSNLLKNYTQEFGYDEESVVYQVVNPAFDIFLADLVASLANGSTLVLAKHQIPSVSEMEQNAVTHAYIMPAYLPKMCSDNDMKVLARLKVLMFGGESANENFVRKALFFKVPMIQLFGFTEHAVYTNFQWIRKLSDCSLIGHPFESTQAIVVDKDGQIKPDGFKGNLLSVGLGVCRGYFEIGNSNDLRTFNSRRAFSTGDICCKQQDGSIEFLGRKDEVLKLNGQKVYVGKVDQLISKLDSVQQAATIGLKAKDGSQKLIVFVVTTSTIEQILCEIKEKYPEWTLPIVLQKIEALPLNSNGKTDKQRLVAIASQFEDKKDVSLTSLVNEDDLIAKIFRQFLGENYKLEDDFLSAGIDSIQLLQVVQTLEDQLSIELDVRHAFRSRNARDWLKTKKAGLKISQIEPPKEGPVTWNQEHVWLLRDCDPDHADSYRIKLELKFVEKVDKTKLIKAVNRIVKENESLRIRIQLDPRDNQLKQLILPHEDDWFLTCGKFPISLQFQSDYSVQIEFDHSTVDGYSLRLVVDALSKYYKDPLASSKISNFLPIEFARAQRRKLFTDELDYFRAEFADSINDQLPTQVPRSSQTGHRARHERINISTTSLSKLTDRKFNLFYLTLTAYLKQLSEETNRTSLTVGIPFANRSTGNANAVGYFANALPIRVNLEGKDAKELVECVQQKVLKTVSFSEVPFSFLVRQLQPKRDRQINPIFQRMLMFEDFSVESVDNLFTVQEIDSNSAKFDQTWHAHKTSQNQLEVHVEYNQSLFTSERVKKSLESFKHHFNQLVAAFSNTSNKSSQEEEIKNKLFRFLKDELAQPNTELTEDSNFFELGLHSLNAALLASRIRSELGLNCSTRQIFEHQTINELVLMLKGQSFEVSHLQATILRSMKDSQLSVLRDQYCNEFSVKLSNMNREKIEEKLFQMIREQEAFRTQFFFKDGQFLMQVLSDQPLNLPYCIKSEDFQMEVVFIDLRDDNELHIRLSHLLSDNHSMQIMMNYLSDGFSTKIASISDFNSKFNEKCKGNEEKNLEFWKSTLNIPNGSLFREHHVQLPTKSAGCSLTLSKSVVVEELKRSKVSPNAFLLHKLANSLKHWQAIEDQEKQLYIGVAKDMRSSLPTLDFSQTVGFFSQTLPVPCKNKTVNELNSLLFDVYDHSFVSYEQLLEFTKQSTLFEVMLVLDVEDGVKLEIKEPKDVNGKFPLTFYVKLTNQDVNIQLVYWSELWSEETARLMLETFASKIKLDQETSTCLTICQSASFVDPIERIHWFGQKSPNSLAIQSITEKLTYSELCQKTNHISNAIKQRFSSLYGDSSLKNAVIMVVGQNSIQTLTTCLAVMTTGAAYLPINQALNSPTRIRRIYEETRAKTIISSENTFELQNWISFEELWSANSAENLDSPLSDPTDLAYIIYTSGTTGKPKAVQIERKSLWNTIQDATKFLEVTESDCIYQFTKFCFDNSVLEIFVALCNGARLFVQEEEFGVATFCAQIEKFKITHAFLYPGLVDTFTNEELTYLQKLKCWIVGAEKLNKHLMERALDLDIKVIQNYGPTETTCYALRRRMQKGDDPQNLGTPVPGLMCKLSTKNVPPMAAPRELLISGIGLMKGYIGDTSQQCFVQIDGQRYYKTGDLCRWTRNGEILFVGRTDSVVKVRGFRVDLNEVEANLLGFGKIKQVKVLANQENVSAYFVANHQIKASDLKAHCIVHLPRYAVPDLFFQLEKIPLTSNNKIDTKALMTPESTNSNMKQGVLTEKQLQIVKLWSEMFERQVGIDESFFEIGGNSLSAQRMLNRLEKIFGMRLSISDLMMSPTISEIEKLLNTIDKPSTALEVNQSRFPLSFQQEQMLFLEEISEPGEYNLQFLQFFTKQLDCERLFCALEELVAKNDILRTKVVEIDSEFYQQLQNVTFERPQIEKISTGELKELIKTASKKKFNLFEEIPLRLRFFEVNNEHYCLLLEQHHLISDGTSTMLIEEQISNSYNNLGNIRPSMTYAQWSAEQKAKKKKFKEMAYELRNELSSITNAIDLKKAMLENADSKERMRSMGEVRSFVELIDLDAKRSSPFAWLCTQLAQTFTQHFNQQTLIIGAPVQNRNEKTAQVLGNFLNNLVIPLNYNSSLDFAENLKSNEKNIARSLRFSELPFSFVQQQSGFFDVYVNCRYTLENESSLRMDEKCTGMLLEEDLPPKCHYFLEIDFDELEAGRFRVVWRTKSASHLMDQLFNKFRRLIKNPNNDSANNGDELKVAIRQAFQQTLLTDLKFSDLDDYFVLGGTSLSFLRLYRLLKSRLNLHGLDATAFLADCTVDSIYAKILNAYDEHSIRKVNIRFVCNGSGDTFVFFPTLFGGLLAYRHVFEEIQKQHPQSTVIGVDVSDSTCFESIDGMAKQCSLDLWHFIKEQKLNTKSVHFVGASFGALLAYETLCHIKKHLHGFCSLTSIDGIANSNQVNTLVTFEQHREQTEQSLSSFELDPQTRQTLVQNSWQLLQLANKHSIGALDRPRFHLFLLMIARQSNTTELGWANVGIQQRWLRLDGSHSSMMDRHRSGWLVERLFHEIDRAKTLKKP